MLYSHLGDSDPTDWSRGAFALLFETDLSAFGIEFQGINGYHLNPGDTPVGDTLVQISFYKRNGDLINTIGLNMDNDEGQGHNYTFTSETSDIAGVTITNTDCGGIVIDELRLVPEPSTFTLLSLAVLSLLVFASRGRKTMV